MQATLPISFCSYGPYCVAENWGTIFGVFEKRFGRPVPGCFLARKANFGALSRERPIFFNFIILKIEKFLLATVILPQVQQICKFSDIWPKSASMGYPNSLRNDVGDHYRHQN